MKSQTTLQQQWARNQNQNKPKQNRWIKFIKIKAEKNETGKKKPAVEMINKTQSWIFGKTDENTQTFCKYDQSKERRHTW